MNIPSIIRSKSALTLLLIPGLLLSSPVATAVELEIEGQTGIDSNPLKLSNAFDPDAEFFVFGDLAVEAGDDFFAAGRFQQAVYPDNDVADWSRNSLSLGYRSEFDWDDRDFRYELSVKQSEFDFTYVSRSTGLPGVFGGTDIGDRFDSDYRDYDASIAFHAEKDIRYRLSYQRREKDYRDFSSAGLSDLDYEHDSYAFDVRVRPNDISQFNAELRLTGRDYLDRRADDENGDDIPGTDMKYDYTQLALAYRIQPSDAFRLRLSYSHRTREDNGGGYWDSTREEFKVQGRFFLSGMKTLDLEIRSQEKAYDNRVVADQASLEEENRESKGTRFRVKYSTFISRSETRELKSYFEYESSDVTSTDADYEYDRYILSVGLTWEVK